MNTEGKKLITTIYHQDFKFTQNLGQTTVLQHHSKVSYHLSSHVSRDANLALQDTCKSLVSPEPLEMRVLFRETRMRESGNLLLSGTVDFLPEFI